jgi:hypothetical protein
MLVCLNQNFDKGCVIYKSIVFLQSKMIVFSIIFLMFPRPKSYKFRKLLCILCGICLKISIYQMLTDDFLIFFWDLRLLKYTTRKSSDKRGLNTHWLSWTAEIF